MNDQEFARQLREKTDATPIPDRLLPEHISEQLAQSPKKKSWYKSPWVPMAATFLLLAIVGTSVWTVNLRQKNDSNMMNLAASDSLDNSINEESDYVSPSNNNLSESPIATAKSYQELYALLSDLSTQRLLYGVDDVEMETAVAEDMNDSAITNSSMTTQGNADQDRSEPAYSDTNTQVENVAEADIVKTDGDYIYSCFRESGYGLNAISIAKTEHGTLTACSVISPESISEAIDCEDFFVEELYLQKDRMILICEGTPHIDDEPVPYSSALNRMAYGWGSNENTYILTYDVFDPTHPTLVGNLTQEGYYKSSRFTNGCLYTFSSKWVAVPERYQDYEVYVPSIEDAPLNCTDIYLPACPDDSCYQVMTGMKLDAPDHFIDSKAILSGNGIYYVSNDHIYFAQQKWENGATFTELFKFRYADGSIEPLGSLEVDGYLLNQFAMDEYKGYLRVVTTVTPAYIWDDVKPAADTVESKNRSATTNALFVIDSNMNLVGSIKNLALDERVYSVRFMGDAGYFVTYRETDPLFSVDLSDPANPKIMDALKIPGFSNYMHFYSEDLLFGLGEEIDPDTGEFLGAKLSMFDISDPYNIVEKDKTVLSDVFYTSAQYNHKALLIDPEKNLIGFYAEEYSETDYVYKDAYVIYSYIPNRGFQQQFYCQIDQDPIFSEDGRPYSLNYYLVRGIYIDDYLYVINGNRIRSYSLDTYTPQEGLIIRGDGNHVHENYVEDVNH